MNDTVKSEKFSLSEIQQAYYVGCNGNFELGGRSTKITYVLKTDLNMDKFEESFNYVIKHQDMLRAVILNENEQKILSTVSYYKIEKSYYDDFIDNEKDILEREINLIFNEKFESNKWPLFKVKNVNINKSRYLIISFDMLIADAFSFYILAKDVMTVYEKGYFALEEIEHDYMEYINCKEIEKNGNRYLKDKEFWLKNIKNIPLAPQIPLISVRNTDNVDFTVERESLYLDKDKWLKIQEAAKQHNVSPTAVLFTAYLYSVSRWSKNDEFTINMTMNDRKGVKYNGTIGDFTSSLLISFNSNNIYEYDFWENANTVKKIMRTAYSHSSFSSLDIIKEISKEYNIHSLATMPIVFTSLLFNKDSKPDIGKIGEVIKGISQTPQVFMDCIVTEMNEELFFTIDYVTEYMEKEIVQSILEFINILLVSLIEKKDRKINLKDNPLYLLEKNKWKEFNKTNTKIKELTLTDLFEKSVAEYPQNTAVVDGNGKDIKYFELKKMVDQKALYLKSLGIFEKDTVGLFFEKNIDLIVDILAVLKTGSAFTLLKKDISDKCKEYLKNEMSVKIIENNDFENNLLKDTEYVNFKTEINDNAYIGYEFENIENPIAIKFSNKILSRTIQSLSENLKITESDKILSSLNTDRWIYDIFCALSAGAGIVLIEDIQELKNWNRELCDKITIWNTTVDEFMKVKDDLSNPFKEMRHILLFDGRLNFNQIKDFYKIFNKAQINAIKGICDFCFGGAVYVLECINENNGNVIIHTPYKQVLDGFEVYILDQKLNLCQFGKEGNIYIGGENLGSIDTGKNLTDDKFIIHNEFGKLYKTGEIGVFNAKNNCVDVLGNEKNKVKVKGFVFMLEEIKNRIGEYPKVSDVSVQLDENSNTITAFVEVEKDIEKSDFMTYMKKVLSYYMIPDETVFLDEESLQNGYELHINKNEKKENIQKESPKTENENVLYEIWKDILIIDDFSINDNFFELGGDSVKATQIYSKLKLKGYSIDIKDLYQNNTIKKLAYVMRSQNDKLKTEYVNYESGEI